MKKSSTSGGSAGRTGQSSWTAVANVVLVEGRDLLAMDLDVMDAGREGLEGLEDGFPFNIIDMAVVGGSAGRRVGFLNAPGSTCLGV